MSEATRELNVSTYVEVVFQIVADVSIDAKGAIERRLVRWLRLIQNWHTWCNDIEITSSIFVRTVKPAIPVVVARVFEPISTDWAIPLWIPIWILEWKV